MPNNRETKGVSVNAFEILRELKSKVELSAQIDESETIVSEISGNKDVSKAVVMREIEGKIKMVEVAARVLEMPCRPKLRLLPA